MAEERPGGVGRGESLTRPLTGVDESYNSLAGGRKGGKPTLAVTGAKLGEMRVDTSRGPAVVPAWLFTLDGYDSPSSRPLPSLRSCPNRRSSGPATFPAIRSTAWSRFPQTGDR